MEIAKTIDGNNITFTITGRVDTLTAPELGGTLEKLAGSEVVTLDLAGVPYMSSAGLRVLLAAQKKAMKSGGSLTLIKVTDAVKEVLNLTGFSAILTIQ